MNSCRQANIGRFTGVFIAALATALAGCSQQAGTVDGGEHLAINSGFEGDNKASTAKYAAGTAAPVGAPLAPANKYAWVKRAGLTFRYPADWTSTLTADEGTNMVARFSFWEDGHRGRLEVVKRDCVTLYDCLSNDRHYFERDGYTITRDGTLHLDGQPELHETYAEKPSVPAFPVCWTVYAGSEGDTYSLKFDTTRKDLDALAPTFTQLLKTVKTLR